VLARAYPRTGGALRLAAELVDDGFTVALEQVPRDAVPGVLARLAAAGLAGQCEVTLPVGRPDDAGALDAGPLADAGPTIALAGPRPAVTVAADRLPAARVVIPAVEGEPWCRDLADGRVRLTSGRGARTDLAFVRCLNVLMAGGGHHAVATSDPRLVAITGERAAWNGRTPDSWEHVMPYGVRLHDQRRLLAAGYRVRVAVRAGRSDW
jgi:proline dehydrogenase